MKYHGVPDVKTVFFCSVKKSNYSKVLFFHASSTFFHAAPSSMKNSRFDKDFSFSILTSSPSSTRLCPVGALKLCVSEMEDPLCLLPVNAIENISGAGSSKAAVMILGCLDPGLMSGEKESRSMGDEVRGGGG
jgi:hypothetical protein